MKESKISEPCFGKNKSLSIFNLYCLMEKCAQHELVSVPRIIPVFQSLFCGNWGFHSPLVELFASRSNNKISCWFSRCSNLGIKPKDNMEGCWTHSVASAKLYFPLEISQEACFIDFSNFRLCCFSWWW